MVSGTGGAVGNWRVQGTADITASDNTSVTIRMRSYIQAYTNYAYAGLNVHGGACVDGQWASVDRTGVSVGANSAVLMAEKTLKVSKGHASRTVGTVADIRVSGYAAGYSTVSLNVSVPAKPSHTVRYDANYGTGAPSAQTKWYGENLYLSNAKPTRANYVFQGWGTNRNGPVLYQPGARFMPDADTLLYAVWKPVEHTVRYDANGGSGAPAAQKKVYGQQLNLSTTAPTRTNYVFEGWSTSRNGSVAYQPGDRYEPDADMTLYAAWKLSSKPPVISQFVAQRVNSSGNPDDAGTRVRLSATWSVDTDGDSGNTVQSVVFAHYDPEADSWVDTAVSASGTSGTSSTILSSLGADRSWRLRVTVTDKHGGSSATTTIGPQRLLLDFSPSGKGIGIGIGAPDEGVSIYGSPVLINGYDLIPHVYASGEFLTYNAGFADYTGATHNISRCYAYRSGYLLVLQIECTGTFKNGYTDIGVLKDAFIPRTAINVTASYNTGGVGSAFVVGPVQDDRFPPGHIYFGNPTTTTYTWAAATFVCVVNE